MKKSPRHPNFIFLSVCLSALSASAVAAAPDAPTPFYYASSTIFDKQAATLLIGVNDSIGQAVVSQDRKSVTLNMDPSLLGNAGIRQFNYQRGGLGFVGSAKPAVGAAAGAANPATPSIAMSPAQIAPAVSPLDKPGMVLIEPLER
jgi:hypothetical protein